MKISYFVVRQNCDGEWRFSKYSTAEFLAEAEGLNGDPDDYKDGGHPAEDFKDQREGLSADRTRTFKLVFLAHQTMALGLDRVTRLSAAVVDGTISQSSIPRGRRRVRTAFFSSHVRLPRHHDLRAGAASGCHSHDCVALCRSSAISAAAPQMMSTRCFEGNSSRSLRIRMS